MTDHDIAMLRLFLDIAYFVFLVMVALMMWGLTTGFLRELLAAVRAMGSSFAVLGEKIDAIAKRNEK